MSSLDLDSTFKNRPPERFPIDTQVPRMEDSNECNAIELWSRKELPDPYKNQDLETIAEKGSPGMEKENEDGWVEM